MRALISVSDKTGVVGFAQALGALGVEIISTGGTLTRLADNGVNAIGVSAVTGFAECLDGRVKTLHPAVHGGILAMRGKPDHMRQLADLQIEAIDVVVINLYPFRETIEKPDATWEEIVENIDIGGPAMLRSAAKNHKDVVVICDPGDYPAVLAEWKEKKGVSYDMRYKLALKAFEHTAAYDALIAAAFRARGGVDVRLALPDKLTLAFEKIQDLRYGENPHQSAVYYREALAPKGGLADAEQLHGKALSFNNIHDANGAVEALKEFSDPTVVAVKHANPCGVGSGFDIFAAYEKARDGDPVSIFGGVVAANRPISAQTAEEISKIFIEIVIAPDFTDAALDILKRKDNIRLLKLAALQGETPPAWKPESGETAVTPLDMKKTGGGLLVQEADRALFDESDMKIVTDRIPTEREKKDMIFAMKAVKHVKSNGIVIAKDNMTIGIGAGQTNRIWAVENAIRQANTVAQVRDGESGAEAGQKKRHTTGAAMASDAFFPFSDCVEAAAAAGITAIIQPGGSARDAESIQKANALGLAMVFTGMRHFKH